MSEEGIPLQLVLAQGGELPLSKPEAVGLSSTRLAELKPAWEKLVDQGRLAGGVALVARHGKIAWVTSFGYRDLADKTPMTEDTIFRIASMTKPITCVAAMSLVEQGGLSLDDPVGRYLPDLNDLRVLGDAKDDTVADIATVPARRPITVRHLLAHTSGIAYEDLISDARLRRLYLQAGVEGPDLKTIAEQVQRLGRVPLAHQPGEGWTYGLSHDVLGRLIEIVSGERFDRYLQRVLFTPLDMTDTSFFVPEAKRMRLATIYQAKRGEPLTPRPRKYGSETFFSGGGGLFSTARDFARFGQMLLNGGELEGVRILKPQTIAMMTTNQLGEIVARIGVDPVGPYGLGFNLTLAPGSGGGKPVLDSYGWGGYYSTNFRIEPPRDLIVVFMTQVVPTNFADGHGLLRKVAASAIEK
jgi:CubicO group peptidase (beta-lactamase class C family)